MTNAGLPQSHEAKVPSEESARRASFLPCFKRGNVVASTYIALGFLSSQFAQLEVYSALSADRVQTWWSNLGIATITLPVPLVAVMCLLLAGALFLGFHSYTMRAHTQSRYARARRGALITVAACTASQAVFASVMRCAYETLFSMLAVSAVVMSTDPAVSSAAGSERQVKIDAWDAFKFAVTVAISVPVLSTGAALIAGFWDPAEMAARRYQLYRHVAMIFYFELGALTFLIVPLAAKLLRDGNRVDGR